MADRIDTEQIKANVDLRELAGRHTTLKRESATEMSGPCPKCGGSDRLHVQAQRFMCRQCHPDWKDPIEFVRWHSGVGFIDACKLLNSGAELPTMPTTAQHRRPAVKRRPEKRPAPAWDQQRGERLVSDAQDALWTSEPAIEYLRGRGLLSHTWLQYGLGYVARSPTAERAPAIVLPWYRDEKLAAVRFRFLDPQVTTDKAGKQHTAKIKALRGSQFSGLLFGGQAELWPHLLRTLVICEGEINAMSIWQVAYESRLDVLSLGSESARLTPAMIDVAQQYGQVLIWADRAEVAKDQALEIGAKPIDSETLGDADANDLLQEGALGYVLSSLRHSFAESEKDRLALLWALWDSANTLLGVDAGTARLIGKLASELGKEAKLIEAEPGRWIADSDWLRLADGAVSATDEQRARAIGASSNE